MMKSIKIFLLFLMLFSFYTYREVKGQINTNELSELIKIAQKENIRLNSLKIYITKSVEDVRNVNDVQKEIEKIKRTEEGYEWDIKRNNENEEQHYIAVGNKQIESKDIQMRVIVTAFLVGNKYRIFHSYEIKSKWSKDAWEYVNANFKKELNQHDVFYTLSGTMKIEDGLELRQKGNVLLSKFYGTFVEGLIEDDFISLSAYTDLLDSNFLMVNDKKINLQIGLRKNPTNDFIDVKIGNPIITSGY